MSTTNTTPTPSRQIFVVMQGFVLLTEGAQREGDEWRLTNASVIRRWGTTRGLGEIALNGPTKDTVLDPCGAVVVPAHQVLMRLACTYEG